MLDFVKSQQFCVKWNSYSSNLQSVFPRLLNSEHFVDITLACEGQMIKCHKVVLSACSTYFEKLLVQNPCQHPIIFMKDMKHWEVQALVDFMYRGEVNVSQEELNSLLVAAEALQIRGLCGSDNANRQQEGVRQPSSPLSKIPAVSLPNDIELSGGTSLGHESPPQKKRKIPGDEKDPSQSVTPRISSVSGSTLGADSNVVLAPSASSDQFRTDGPSEDVEEDLKDKRIKQEVETDDNFLEGDGDGGVPDDEAGVEQQEDSDSNNREDVHSNALLDQPGPSGIATTGPAEKAATELNAAYALQNVMCVLSPSMSAGKIPIMAMPNTPDSKEYIPMPSPGSSPGSTRVRRSEAELRKAAECVQKGMTFQNVSDAFNIPISTIRFYMARRGILPQRRRGRISNSAQNPAASQSQQPPYMVLHYKLPDIQKKTT
ncbi:hypothetical protein R5R35_005381 [Gryllus longicercus]|uniref:BTB domain-containing protein n=1 Tax=Gryllus longicercus TaxID=2509291 RepID=A0AAN9V3Z0_9ORTH